MKRWCAVTLGMLVVFSLPVAAAAEEHSGFHDDLVADLERSGGKLMQLAEAIDAADYGWRPNVEVRTVSEVLMHVAGTNLLLPSALGAPLAEGMEMPLNPFAQMQEWERTIRDKDQVVAKLGESLEYVAAAARKIEDLDTKVTLFGGEASKRAYLLILLTHVHEHLGQSIAYARSLGVPPPWSRPQPAPEASEEG